MATVARAAAIRQLRQAMTGYLATSMIERTSMLPRRASGILEATSTASLWSLASIRTKPSS
jgi:hypothetical protein